MNNFKIINFLQDIIRLSPRQGENEKKTADFLILLLKKNYIKYYLQKFITKIPIIKQEILKVDGDRIRCKGCSFISGKIYKKDEIISSLISSQVFINKPNINFNPKCKNISLSNFYFAPALAVKFSDLDRIKNSKTLEGIVKVEPYSYKSRNILVGNIKSPKNILFAHYDSVESGAIDNASGVSVLMFLILKYQHAIKNSLIVFIGNEELSYDYPIYWGHGYREFENNYYNLLKKAKKIFIIDCVGNGKTIISKNKELMIKGFPIENLKKIEKKVFLIHGDVKKLMQVYHSGLDAIKNIKEKYISDAIKMILSNLE